MLSEQHWEQTTVCLIHQQGSPACSVAQSGKQAPVPITGNPGFHFIPSGLRLLDQLTQAPSRSYAYDANGNPMSDGRYSYTYDSQNRLTEVQ